jgi:hypothetical protein
MLLEIAAGVGPIQGILCSHGVTPGVTINQAARGVGRAIATIGTGNQYRDIFPASEIFGQGKCQALVTSAATRIPWQYNRGFTAPDINPGLRLA